MKPNKQPYYQVYVVFCLDAATEAEAQQIIDDSIDPSSPPLKGHLDHYIIEKVETCID